MLKELVQHNVNYVVLFLHIFYIWYVLIRLDQNGLKVNIKNFSLGSKCYKRSFITQKRSYFIGKKLISSNFSEYLGDIYIKMILLPKIQKNLGENAEILKLSPKQYFYSDNKFY